MDRKRWAVMYQLSRDACARAAQTNLRAADAVERAKATRAVVERSRLRRKTR